MPVEEKKILLRRKYIQTTLQKDGKISASKMKSWLETKGQTFSPKAMDGDIEFLNILGSGGIFKTEDPETNEVIWVDNSRKLGATRNERMGHNREAKRNIGELVGALVVGLSKFRFGPEQSTAIIEKKDLILGYLQDFFKRKGGDPTRLLDRLASFWGDSQRTLFLDAGTTTEYFAKDYLQHFPLPLKSMAPPGRDGIEEPQVNKIEVVTNDRLIFYCLGEQEVKTKTIIVGGRQQFRSAAVSGRMAERFIKSNDLWAGMGIVGISSLCLPERRELSEYFYAENEYLAAMKLLFLERSRIKIIIADSSKFKSSSEQGDTRVCEINKNQVDLVITETASKETIAFFENRCVPLIRYDAL
jgi:DeoR/GlpR family transcriptional regulator of sugar metabolism